MTDSEFAAWLRSIPREHTPEESEALERQHDAERGLYVPHAEIRYHTGESAH